MRQFGRRAARRRRQRGRQIGERHRRLGPAADLDLVQVDRIHKLPQAEQGGRVGTTRKAALICILDTRTPCASSARRLAAGLLELDGEVAGVETHAHMPAQYALRFRAAAAQAAGQMRDAPLAPAVLRRTR